MKTCIITREQRELLLSYEFPFEVPFDLALLDKIDLIQLARTLHDDGCLDFINDEPTTRCITSEKILDKIQDNLFPDIYDLI